MRYRVIIETDFIGTRATFARSLRSMMHTGELAKVISGDIVYVATEVADSEVISHDGKTVTG